MAAILPRRRVHIRCSNERCKKRQTLAKHPDEYRTPWRCAGCGGARFRVTPESARERGRSATCDCGGYGWGGTTGNYKGPHRRGSPQCWYRADGTTRAPGDPDWFDDGSNG